MILKNNIKYAQQIIAPLTEWEENRKVKNVCFSMRSNRSNFQIRSFTDKVHSQKLWLTRVSNFKTRNRHPE